MFKRIYMREYAPVISDYALANDAWTGMAVSANHAAKTCDLATGAVDLFILDKNPIATGVYAAVQEALPDSAEAFNSLSAGDRPNMVKPIAGEVFAVSAEAIVNVATFVNAATVTANAGKWEPADVNSPTKYKPVGTTMVGSTMLYKIAVAE